MGVIGYYIAYTFIRLVTLLPMSILYIFSYPLYFILYYFPGYRKKVTRKNLINSFPEKSIDEIVKIEKRFYRHLADLFLETLKGGYMSEKEIRRRFVVVNPEMPGSIIASGRDVLAVGGHYNNWEWLIATPLHLNVRTLIIYKPLSNKKFDRLIFNIRSRFGITLTPMSHIVREIISSRKEGANTMSVFIADQTPPRSEINYWTTFMGQDTPVYLGSEKISLKYDMAVLFMNIRKVKRGHYELTFEELFKETTGLRDHEITEAHVKRLEEIIRERPEYWIWTHRRWKHKKEVSGG
ncbi:MAG: lysophospholipid acyltransferase family protein [Bacteroidales bacterium]